MVPLAGASVAVGARLAAGLGVCAGAGVEVCVTAGAGAVQAELMKMKKARKSVLRIFAQFSGNAECLRTF